MELNLHGFELVEAKMEVLQTLALCLVNDDYILDLIHGFHHGTILLNFFRSQRFLAELRLEGFVIRKIEAINQGKTRFYLKKP